MGIAAKALQLLKSLASRVPWNKVATFLKWCADFAARIGKLTADAATKVYNFIKNNPGKIVDWFLKGYSVAEIIRMILG
jgi:hypothetical protein